MKEVEQMKEYECPELEVIDFTAFIFTDGEVDGELTVGGLSGVTES